MAKKRLDNDDEYVLLPDEPRSSYGDVRDIGKESWKAGALIGGICLLLLALSVTGYLLRDTLFPKAPPAKPTVMKPKTSGFQFLEVEVGAGAGKSALRDGQIWVLYPDELELRRIDSKTGKTVATITLPERPNDLAVGQAKVWVSLQTGVAGVRISDGKIGKLIPTGDFPSDLELQGKSIWVINQEDDTITLIDAPRQSVISTRNIPPGPFTFDADNRGAWIAHEDLDDEVNDPPLVTRVERTGKRLTARIEVDEDVQALVETPRWVWLVHTSLDSLSHIDPRTRKLDGSLIPIGHRPRLADSAPRRLWIIYQTDQAKPVYMLGAFDDITGEIQETLSLGKEKPTDLAVEDNLIWVARSGSKHALKIDICSPRVPCRPPNPGSIDAPARVR